MDSKFRDLKDEQDLAVPAVFADRFACRVLGGNLRVSFGETILGEDIRYTSAILVSADQAQQLSLLLKELLVGNNLWTEPEVEAGTNVKQP